MLSPSDIKGKRESWRQASGKNQGDLGDAFDWAHANVSALLSHVLELEERLRRAEQQTVRTLNWGFRVAEERGYISGEHAAEVVRHCLAPEVKSDHPRAASPSAQ